MNETEMSIIVTCGIAIFGGLVGMIKYKVDKFIKDHEKIITLYEAKLKAELGETAYKADVDIIKNAVKNLQMNKEAITVTVADNLVKAVTPKLTTIAEKEALTIVAQIIKGLI